MAPPTSPTHARRRGRGPHRVGRRADAGPALDPRALRVRASARRPGRRRVPARDVRDRESRAHAGGRRRRRRAVRVEPVRHAGRRRRRAGRRRRRGPRRARRRRRGLGRPRGRRGGPRAADHARRRRRPAERAAPRPARSARRAAAAAPRRRRPGSCGCARCEAEGKLACPVLAVNEAVTERFNDRFGTGQSTIDGILRTTNLLLAGRTLVVLGYGWTGKGIALRAARARRVGDHLRGRSAARARGADGRLRGACRRWRRPSAATCFVTVTGGRDVLRAGALRAHEGRRRARQRRALRRRDRHRRRCASGADSVREVRPLVEQFTFGGRRLNLLAGGRVVNLAAAEGHPAAVMDISFALQALAAEELARAASCEPGVHPVPEAHRPRGGGAQARVARRADRRAQRGAGALPPRLGRVTADGRTAGERREDAPRGAPGRGDRHVPRTTTSSSPRARPGCSPSPRSSRSRTCSSSTTCPRATRRSTRRSCSSSTAASAPAWA